MGKQVSAFKSDLVHWRKVKGPGTTEKDPTALSTGGTEYRFLRAVIAFSVGTAIALNYWPVSLKFRKESAEQKTRWGKLRTGKTVHAWFILTTGLLFLEWWLLV